LITRRRNPVFRLAKGTGLALAFWVIIFSAASIITVYRVIGWIAATVAISGAAYWAGTYRERQAGNRRQKIAVSSVYGTPRPQAYLGGAYPAAPVREIDAVSAYPASMVNAQIIDRATDALTGLGWRKSDGLISARNAVAALTATGEPVTLPAVITAALRAAGASQGTRIEPNGG
jgi:hypothetical protein